MLTKKPQTQNKRNMTIHLPTNTVQKRSKSSIFGYKITKKRDKKAYFGKNERDVQKCDQTLPNNKGIHIGTKNFGLTGGYFGDLPQLKLRIVKNG